MKIYNNTISSNVQNLSTQQHTKKTEETKKLSRVEEIKQQIKNGTYEINIDKTASALAKSLLN